MCCQSQYVVKNLTILFKNAQDALSYTTPYNLKGTQSSHSISFPSNHFQRDPRLPIVEVNKFQGSDPTGWVTQMEHCFYLHDITNDLEKLMYGVLHLDSKHCKWWKWRKNVFHGYVFWI
jgi:hypothetical protein